MSPPYGVTTIRCRAHRLPRRTSKVGTSGSLYTRHTCVTLCPLVRAAIGTLATRTRSRSAGNTAKRQVGNTPSAESICASAESDAENSLHFLNRKGFFSINLQAIADADWKFLWYSMETAGGTHDSLAFKVSELGRSLEDKGLPKDYWIAGDDAYACSEYLLTPYAKQSCRGCRERDDFNFYQSRCRINEMK